MIEISPEEFEQVSRYLMAAAGDDFAQYWMRVKWRMAASFQSDVLN